MFRERIAFELYEKKQVDRIGESRYRLFRDNVDKDPQAQKFIPYF
jgi:hypothetical protein